MPALADWYHVRYDGTAVHRPVAPSNRAPWSDSFDWADVIRVCFMAGDWLTSDDLYVFTSRREESYLIPTDADGGSALTAQPEPAARQSCANGRVRIFLPFFRSSVEILARRGIRRCKRRAAANFGRPLW